MTVPVNIILDPIAGPSPDDAMAMAMAKRICSLRKAHDFTFDELAKRAGVSKGTLVQIEQERGNPSISTLCRLAATLGVSVADLVTPANAARSRVSVISKGGARRLWTGPNGGSAVLLAGTTGPDMLEVWQWDLRPGERYESSRHGRGTRELIHVTRGKLLLDVDGACTLIASGGTAIALTDQAHAYANPGTSPVRFFMTVHEPATTP